MVIEFHNTAGEVQDWIIGYIRDKLVQLQQCNKEISKAQVYLKSQAGNIDYGKVCEIDLTLKGDSYIVCNKSTSYERAVRDTLVELTEKISGAHHGHKEPPEEPTEKA